MNLGLYVLFDGEKNIINNENFPEYPIGGMICEFSRMEPIALKYMILGNIYYDDPFEFEIFLRALICLYKQIKEEFGIVSASITVSEFISIYSAISDIPINQLDDVFSEAEKHVPDLVRNAILQDTGFEKFGLDYVGQAMLSLYYIFTDSISFFQNFFNMVATETYDDATLEAFASLFSEEASMQDIDFRIIYCNGKFQSEYTIRDTLSLLVFEITHMLSNGIKLTKCKNCGKFFVPTGRADAKYCGYPSPENPEKKCRDIGAQNTRTKIMKNDLVTQEYRRLYSRLKMAIKRHPENIEFQKKLNILTEKMKELRTKRKDGDVSSDDILEWLYQIESTL